MGGRVITNYVWSCTMYALEHIFYAFRALDYTGCNINVIKYSTLIMFIVMCKAGTILVRLSLNMFMIFAFKTVSNNSVI